MSRAFALVLILFSSVGFAEDILPLPFTQAIAADQNIVISTSLEHEALQADAIADWYSSKDRLKINGLKRDQAKKEFLRAQERMKMGTITVVTFNQIAYAYQELEAKMIQLQHEIDQAKVRGLVQKYKTLEFGNPGTDHSAEILQALIEGYELKIKALESLLPVAETAHKLAKEYLEGGKNLTGRAIPQIEFEQRQMSWDIACDQEEAIRLQIQVAKTTLENLKRSRQRVGALVEHSGG